MASSYRGVGDSDHFLGGDGQGGDGGRGSGHVGSQVKMRYLRSSCEGEVARTGIPSPGEGGQDMPVNGSS